MTKSGNDEGRKEQVDQDDQDEREETRPEIAAVGVSLLRTNSRGIGGRRLMTRISLCEGIVASNTIYHVIVSLAFHRALLVTGPLVRGVPSLYRPPALLIWR